MKGAMGSLDTMVDMVRSLSPQVPQEETAEETIKEVESDEDIFSATPDEPSRYLIKQSTFKSILKRT